MPLHRPSYSKEGRRWHLPICKPVQISSSTTHTDATRRAIALAGLVLVCYEGVGSEYKSPASMGRMSIKFYHKSTSKASTWPESSNSFASSLPQPSSVSQNRSIIGWPLTSISLTRYLKEEDTGSCRRRCDLQWSQDRCQQDDRTRNLQAAADWPCEYRRYSKCRPSDAHRREERGGEHSQGRASEFQEAEAYITDC